MATSSIFTNIVINDPKKAEVLEQIIAAKTGRQVKVKMILQADD